jgi:hypothetical protein
VLALAGWFALARAGWFALARTGWFALAEPTRGACLLSQTI